MATHMVRAGGLVLAVTMLMTPVIHYSSYLLRTRGGRSHFFRLRRRSCSKIFESGPDLAILRIWESDSCSDSGHNRWYNRNLPMFLLKKWQHRLLLLPKWKSDPGSGFSQIFYSGPDRKEKPRIFPESTPALQIQSHLCHVPGLGLARVGLLWYVV